MIKTRIGKYIEVFVDTKIREEADSEVQQYCEKLLANPNMEDFEYTIEEVV